MKKIIITYIVSGIALILARFLAYSMVGEIDLMTFAVVNLLPSTLIIVVANIIIQYRKGTTVKSCLVHAVFLSMLSLVINFAATKVVGEQVIDNAIESESEKITDGPSQELLDELDRLARQKMIEEGLISEDEIIYSEPYIGGENAKSNDGEQLIGTWDVQVEKENALSTVMGVMLDILLAFFGGVIGLKLRDRKKMNSLCNGK